MPRIAPDAPIVVCWLAGFSNVFATAPPIPQMKKNFVNARLPHNLSRSVPNIQRPSIKKDVKKAAVEKDVCHKLPQVKPVSNLIGHQAEFAYECGSTCNAVKDLQEK